MEAPRTRLAPLEMNPSMDTRGRASPLPVSRSWPRSSLASHGSSQSALALSEPKHAMSTSNGPYPSMAVRQAKSSEQRGVAKPYMSQPMLSLPGDDRVEDAHSLISSGDEQSPGTSQGKRSMDGERDAGRGSAQTSTPGSTRAGAGVMHKKSPSAPLPSSATPKIIVSTAEVPSQAPVDPDSESTLAEGRHISILSEKGKAAFYLGGRASSDAQRRRHSSASVRPPSRAEDAHEPSSSAQTLTGEKPPSSHNQPSSSTKTPEALPSVGNPPPSLTPRIASSVPTNTSLSLITPGPPKTQLDSIPPAPAPKDEVSSVNATPLMQTTEVTAPQSPTTPRAAPKTLPPSSFRPNLPRLTSLPGFQTLPRPSSSGASFPPSMPGTPTSQPLPSSFVSIPGTPSARLSPAIISRQPVYPILTLPPLPTPQRTRSSTTVGVVGRSDDPAARGATRSGRMRSGSLLSMPALPMEGPDDSRREDHDDDSSLEDVDEEDMDDDMDDAEDEHEHGMHAMESGRSSAFGMSDVDHDIEDDPEEEGGRPSLEIQVERRAEGERPWQIPMPGLGPGIETSPLDTSFLDKYLGAGPSGSRPMSEDRTPVALRREDYFSHKSHAHDGMPALRSPTSPKAHGLPARPHTSSARPTTTQSQVSQEFGLHSVPMPSLGSPRLTARPSLYHQVSRSMVDMSTMLKDRDRSPEIASREPAGLGAAAGASQTSVHTAAESAQDGVLGASIRRQRSMPTFGPATEPPPYPSFPNRPKISIQPRDEEGREPLPGYSNHIYLRSIMPRKMEFTAPGVQARDRKWRRTLCVLEGTAFKVYRCPKGAAGVGVLGEWWERRVGVGDIAEEPRPAPVRSGRPRAPGSERDRERAERERLREIREQEREAARAAKEGEGAAESGASLSLPSTNQSSTAAAAPQPQPVPLPSPVPPPPSTTRSKFGSSFLHPLKSAAKATGSAAGSPTRSQFGSGSDAPEDSRATPSTGRRSLSSLRPSLGGSSHSNSAPSPNPTTASSSMTPSSSTASTSPTRSRRTHTPSASAPNTIAYETPINPLEIPSRPSTTSRGSARRGVRDRGTGNSNPLWREDPDAPPPSPSDLVKAYSLNHAESGLGSDYHKRRNVIRVRVDGEQFLLQAADVASVVDWIEGFQAAANISLDLDERPMPKGPMFPRRRRRRARRPDGQPIASGSGTTGTTGASLNHGSGPSSGRAS